MWKIFWQGHILNVGGDTLNVLQTQVIAQALPKDMVKLRRSTLYESLNFWLLFSDILISIVPTEYWGQFLPSAIP